MRFFHRSRSGIAIVFVVAMLTSCGSQPLESSLILITTGRDAAQFTFRPTEISIAASSWLLPAHASIQFSNQTPNQRHSWVLIRGGDDDARQVVDNASHHKDYLPVNNHSVIASSHMLNPGDQESIEFSTAAAGKYTFICTFPGHFDAGMKGVVVIY